MPDATMSIDRPALSIVAPCFNEEAVLEAFHARMSAVAADQCGQGYEFILINDGSRDSSWAIMQRLAAADPHVVAINLSRNFGHEMALSAGLRICRGELVLIIDADLQDPPELLGAMLDRLDEATDVVYGQRRARDGETAFKKTTSRLFYRILQRLIDVDIPPDTGDFRLMRRRALDVLNTMPEQFRFTRGMISWIGLRQVPFLYDRDARHAGETKYSPLKLMRLAMDAITGFSIIPLRLASLLGLALGGVGLLMLIYVLISFAAGLAVDGWTSLATIMIVLGSAQLIVLGVIGEYVGRAYLETKRRPLYVIERIIGLRAGPDLRAAFRDHAAGHIWLAQADVREDT